MVGLSSTDGIKIDNSISIKKMNYSITWKNMHFIWKKFLSNMGMPNIIFYNTIKNILKERFEYDENNDTFYDVTSKYLPVVSEFIKFWDDTIVYEANTVVDDSLQLVSPLCSPTDYYMLNNYNACVNDTNQLGQLGQIGQLGQLGQPVYEFTNELEIDEILVLFKYWCKTNTASLSTFYETDIIKILRHFYPHSKITNDKFISYVRCNLWNKNKDIDNALEQLKITYKKQNKDVIIDFSDAYYFYAVYVSNLNGKSKVTCETNEGNTEYNNEFEFAMDHEGELQQETEQTLKQSLEHNIKHIVVKKRYFEEYLKFSLSKYIVFDNFISTEWYSEN
jgi:hypothetical protein